VSFEFRTPEIEHSGFQMGLETGLGRPFKLSSDDHLVWFLDTIPKPDHLAIRPV
jgi:hypothetical protein